MNQSSATAAAKVEKSLKYAIYDGSAYYAMVGLTQDYIAPLALALKATSAQIGLLTSIPNLAAALFQLKAPALVQRAGGRKRMILPIVLIHALLWAPLALVPFLFPISGVWWLIAIFTLIMAFSTLANPAWGSMMADLVPEKKRGCYFGARSRVCWFTYLAFALIAALILWLFSHRLFIGFAILFALALCFRLISWYFLAKMYEPPLAIEQQEQFRLLDFIRETRSTNLGRFALYVSAMNFATYLAAPFFAVYILRDLGFDYLTYVLLIVSVILATTMAMTFWGKRADKAGNIKVIAITSCLIPVVPILWLASHNVFYLVLIQLISGFAWAGFNLCSTNFIYDASPANKRTGYIAYFNAMSGTAICLGALLGGLLATHLPPILGYSLLTLFLISGLLRVVVATTFFRHIHEVRRVRKMTTAELIWGKLRLNALSPSFVMSLVSVPVLYNGFMGSEHTPQSAAVYHAGPSPP